MLETDCIIPHHVPIPHREFYALHGTALSVKTLMDDGLSEFAIRRKLHIGEEAYRDAVYEINKQNAVTERNQYFKKENETMPRGEKLNAETVERIRELKADGKTVKEIMEEVGCGKSTVWHVCQHGKTQISKEFDDAVNQMIAESDKPEPVAMNTAKIPEAVLDAVTAQISHLENIVACNLDEIRTLQRENEEYRTKIANMRTWLAEVDT
jgi:hypothetical protein